MVKSREDSIIEIWGTKYINRDVNRLQEDICATIIQCEPGNTSGDYIVESYGRSIPTMNKKKHCHSESTRLGRRQDVAKSCFNCEHFLYCGDGDHVCDLETSAGAIVQPLIDEWDPTEHFFYCGGKKWRCGYAD